MGYQSWVIGSMFGMAYQGYKRKISAMSNEDFNKLDLTQFGFDEMRKMTAMTPQMEQMFAEMRPMLDILAKELGQLLASLPDLVGNVISGGTGSGAGLSTTPMLVNPQGIASNADIWAALGIISQNQASLIKSQTTSALSDAKARTDADIASEKRAIAAKEGAQDRASTRKKIQLPSITPKFTDPKLAAQATRKILTNTILTINATISRLKNDNRKLVVLAAQQTSQRKATLVLLQRTQNQDSRKSFTNQIVKFRNSAQIYLQKVGANNVQISAQLKLLAKTKALL